MLSTHWPQGYGNTAEAEGKSSSSAGGAGAEPGMWTETDAYPGEPCGQLPTVHLPEPQEARLFSSKA